MHVRERHVVVEEEEVERVEEEGHLLPATSVVDFRAHAAHDLVAKEEHATQVIVIAVGDASLANVGKIKTRSQAGSIALIAEKCLSGEGSDGSVSVV